MGKGFPKFEELVPSTGVGKMGVGEMGLTQPSEIEDVGVLKKAKLEESQGYTYIHKYNYIAVIIVYS